MPNVVFLESEARTLSKIEEEYSVIPEHETFHWLARYRPTTQREGSLQNYLFTLKAVHEEKYHQIVTAITGRIVLLNEPDLHLHVSMRNAFVSYLKRMIREQHGQLILASHAPELWQHFTQAQRVELWDRSARLQDNEQRILAEVPL